jgi:CheY-like chemotaxis protein
MTKCGQGANRACVTHYELRARGALESAHHTLARIWRLAITRIASIRQVFCAPVWWRPAMSLPPSRQRLLFVDAAAEIARYRPLLERHFDVTTASSIQASRPSLQCPGVTIIIAELMLPDGSGIELCCRDTSLAAPIVILTTTEAERAPEAIQAGCDALLLKPYSPSLLFNRIGRLLRSRITHAARYGPRQRGQRDHVSASDLPLAGTNVYWPNVACPHCAHSGVTTFEYGSRRRAWYACLECRNVWLA